MSLHPTDPEIARLYYEAYQGIASLFPEGSGERKKCLEIVEIAKAGVSTQVCKN
jgi:hypothetical protein